MRIGLLTGGGDCPGLNAVIRAVVLRAAVDGHDTIGFLNGWRGVLNEDFIALDADRVRDLIGTGGTILGTSRTNPFAQPDGPDRLVASCAAVGLDVLVAIGGDDTLGAAAKLGERGVHVIGVPKTIDNDLSATEMTFGFDTAVQVCVDAIDRLWTTARSHDRVMVCEVMGRDAGHIAAWASIGGAATITLIPEEPIDLDAVLDTLTKHHAAGHRGAIVVVAEGAQLNDSGVQTANSDVDEFGHARLGGIGELLAERIVAGTDLDTRAVALGHVQRGGTPTAFDRVLSTRLGVAAYQAAVDGASGVMVALRAGKIERVSLSEAAATPRLVDLDFVEDVCRSLG